MGRARARRLRGAAQSPEGSRRWPSATERSSFPGAERVAAGDRDQRSPYIPAGGKEPLLDRDRAAVPCLRRGYSDCVDRDRPQRRVPHRETMTFLLRSAIAATLPGSEQLPGADELELGPWVKRFLHETSWLMWLAA